MSKRDRIHISEEYHNIKGCAPIFWTLVAIIDVEVVKEAARRLRNIQRILDAKVPFNSEQFNV